MPDMTVHCYYLVSGYRRQSRGQELSKQESLQHSTQMDTLGGNQFTPKQQLLGGAKLNSVFIARKSETEVKTKCEQQTLR